MFRSWQLISAEFRERWPGFSKEIEAGGDRHLVWLLKRAYELRRKKDVLQLSAALLRRNPHAAIKLAISSTYPLAMRGIVNRMRRRAQQTTHSIGQLFAIGSLDFMDT
jgi:hypothetical protein